jgi:hypothetical protein
MPDAMPAQINNRMRLSSYEMMRRFVLGPMVDASHLEGGFSFQGATCPGFGRLRLVKGTLRFPTGKASLHEKTRGRTSSAMSVYQK